MGNRGRIPTLKLPIVTEQHRRKRAEEAAKTIAAANTLKKDKALMMDVKKFIK